MNEQLEAQPVRQRVYIDGRVAWETRKKDVGRTYEDIIQAPYFLPVKTGLDKPPLLQPVVAVTEQQSPAKEKRRTVRAQFGFIVVGVIILEYVLYESRVFGYDYPPPLR
jgi:hypothetical protein